ncbi:hypothetical protein NW755_000785 [Fusarium falciforme]|uniref:Uncharacterized protein n=1 Tax=Fusarium falciforme TaxID=195108 RepID=A0A9W8V5X5_9HYPO|nr:hypothetical protein NW755_000785 [Fusarium falciforme]KAJ4262052.1 hypothetical protein NW757_000321 [Fusarium falciforme]
MVKRSLASVARPLANLRVPALSARQFSSSPSHGLSAIFSKTENTELNEALGTIQEKIILPAYLPRKQRELVFNPKMRSFIQQNPVVIELDGLEHKFTTIDRFTEIPNSKKALSDVLKLMETKEDWDNLGTLLAGYKKAGIRLHNYHYDKIIRKAGQSKQTYAIIECAKQSSKTNLRLTRKNHLVLLLTQINNKITSPSGEANESAQALKWIELVLDLIQRPEHQGQGAKPTDRVHQSPIVQGLVLFARASSIKAQQAAESSSEVDVQALKDNVEFITSSWTRLGIDDLVNSPVLADLNPRSPLTKENPNTNNHLAVNFYILALAQNIKGMELAQEILGDAAKDLTPIRDALEQHLKNFIKADQRYLESWAETYKLATGREPQWSV